MTVASRSAMRTVAILSFLLLSCETLSPERSGGNRSATTDGSGSDGAGDGAAVMTCGGLQSGACAVDFCHCCPAGGALQRCLCTATCQTDQDCTNPALPHCEHDPSHQSAPGFCTPPPTQFACCWLCD
jgi:hypothetical protein